MPIIECRFQVTSAVCTINDFNSKSTFAYDIAFSYNIEKRGQKQSR